MTEVALAQFPSDQLRSTRRVFADRRAVLIEIRDGQRKPTASEIDLLRGPGRLERAIQHYTRKLTAIDEELKTRETQPAASTQDLT